MAARTIAYGVTYILRSPDNGNILHVNRNCLKKCNVTFLEHQAVDVLIDQFALLPEQDAQNLQVVDACANVNLQMPLPVAYASAVVRLIAPADHPSPAQQKRAARPPGRGTPAP